MYLHETIRDAIITHIETNGTTQAQFYRQPVESYAGYPAFILEYADIPTERIATQTDRRVYAFNLYVVYDHDNEEASREEAEKNISNALGELYNDLFADPGVLNLPNGWVNISNASWGYGTNPDIPMRMAMVRLEVTVYEDR